MSGVILGQASFVFGQFFWSGRLSFGRGGFLLVGLLGWVELFLGHPPYVIVVLVVCVCVRVCACVGLCVCVCVLMSLFVGLCYVCSLSAFSWVCLGQGFLSAS